MLGRIWQRAIIAAGLAAGLASAGLIKEDTATKTLVLLDDWALKESHALFFDHVHTRLGHQVEFAMANEGPQERAGGDESALAFRNIILMAPSLKEAEVATGFSVDQLVAFMKEPDHNLLVFSNSESRRHVRKLANTLGIDFEQPVSSALQVSLR